MKGLVLDTHALLWALGDTAELSAPARLRIEDASSRVEPLWISIISLIEIIYLEEKGRILPGTFDRVIAETSGPDSAYRIAALDPQVALRLRQVPREVVADMPDRIVVATALHLDVPLVTADRRIRQLNIAIVW